MKIKKQRTIYLDYSATTPIDKDVLLKMLPYFGEEYSNPSSMHSSGRRAGQIIVQCREKISKIINSNAGEIIFTGSGTESDNMAIIGIAKAYSSFGNHIIISSIEHKAITESVNKLEKEGFTISIAPVKKDGIIDLEKLKKLITEKTILISIMYANNEIGTIQPINKIAKLIKDWRNDKGIQFPFFHTDACQAAGYLSLNVKELEIDLMTLNGSKIYGPKGIGILYKKENIKIEPLIVGGEQERNLRAGTESIPLIVGFTEALFLADKNKEKESKRLINIRDYLFKEILKKIPKAIINGHKTQRLANNVHISIPNIEGESILLMLDRLGIEASTGSACSAFDLKPSHVLLAIGQDSEFAHGSIRFSLGKSTTIKDIDYLMSVFPNIVNRLLNISSLTIKKYEKIK